MYGDSDRMTDLLKAEAFSKRMGDICTMIPMRGAWEPNDRIALSMASFRLSQEHHGSLYLLYQHGKFASAKALIRSLIEAALRTIWIAETASDERLSAVLKGRKLPLLGELRTYLSFEKDRLFAGSLQGLLDNFTHGGTRAIATQFIEGELLDRGNAVMIALAGFSLGAAGYTIARLLRRNDLLDQLSSATPNVD